MTSLERARHLQNMPRSISNTYADSKFEDIITHLEEGEASRKESLTSNQGVPETVGRVVRILDKMTLAIEGQQTLIETLQSRVEDLETLLDDDDEPCCDDDCPICGDDPEDDDCGDPDCDSDCVGCGIDGMLQALITEALDGNLISVNVSCDVVEVSTLTLKWGAA